MKSQSALFPAGPRPRLKRTIEPFETSDGDVHLMRPYAEDVRVPNPAAADRRLLFALDGTRSVRDLEADFGADKVRETLAAMEAWSLLEDAADEDGIPPATKERLDRQLRYFSDVADGPSAAECQERLRDAKVAVLGVGGLGGRTALELAAIGVGQIHLVDGDEVEMSNLNRQIQYSEADIGSPKVEVMADRLRAFNSEIEVSATRERLESQAEIAEFIDGATFVVASADWPAFEIAEWCNSACFAAGIPYIAMGQLPPRIRIGPLYVPGQTGCFECLSIGYRREYPLLDQAIEQRRAKPSNAATLGPTSGLVAGFMGMEILHFLTAAAEPASLGVGIDLDLLTMTIDREPVIPESECSVCAALHHDEIREAVTR